jgi:cytochrome c oxidase cbb3-type subunit 4
MDLNDLRALATVFTTVAFLAVFFWAYSSKNKARFEDAANIPFADDKKQQPTKGENE